jgi:diguanylate cyclase (GGDEF)-like protein
MLPLPTIVDSNDAVSVQQGRSMDIRNIYEIAAVVLGSLFFYICLIQLSTPSLRGLRWVSLGYACAACGALLIALRSQIPDTFSVLLANALLLMLNVGFYWGIAELLHSTRRWRWVIPPASLVPVLAVQGYFVFVHNLLAPRVVAESAMIAVQCVLLILLLLRNGSQRTLLPRCGLASVFGAWFGFQLLRVYLTPLHQGLSALPVERHVDPKLILLPVLAAVIAGFSFIWLAMTQLQHELELLSETDALTGLMNRRALERSAAREIAISRRRDTPLALIILDLDRFKQLNDSHGHAAGDAALVTAARSISSGLREVDLLARFGGEEFVALLPDTTQEEAIQVAERLRTELEVVKVYHMRKEIQLSASFGVTSLLSEDICVEEIIHRGDLALYQAKHNGRNQVVTI